MLPIQIFRVQDRSMEPAIRSGDYLFVNKWYGKLKVGDIVVLEHPKKEIKIVKRISTLSQNMIYVLGDNKKESEDSRSFGSVPRTSIIGKLIFKT